MAESERLPDVLDQAAELTRRLGDGAIQRARRGASPEQYQRPDGSWPRTDCADCGDTIEAGRLHGTLMEGIWLHIGTPEAIAEAELAVRESAD